MSEIIELSLILCLRPASVSVRALLSISNQADLVLWPSAVIPVKRSAIQDTSGAAAYPQFAVWHAWVVTVHMTDCANSVPVGQRIARRAVRRDSCLPSARAARCGKRDYGSVGKAH